MVAAGSLACVTAGAVRGEFGRRVRAVAATVLQAGLGHAVASDSHDHWRRAPSLDLGPDSPVDRAATDSLVETVPRAIIHASPPVPRPQAEARDPEGERPGGAPVPLETERLALDQGERAAWEHYVRTRSPADRGGL
jgi:hypothetical protein